MKARSLFRVLRWVGLGAAVPALWACTSRSLEKPVVKPEQTFTKTFQQTINRNVDILFLIDDSSSMRLSQHEPASATSRSSCSALREPAGRAAQRPHRASISSDMGAGDGSISGCSRRRQGRNLPVHARAAPARRRPCRPGATFISNVDGVANYTGRPRGRVHLHRGARRERLRLRAPVRGDHARAGRRRRGPPGGERRASCARTRYLAIVLITNEDDCSAAGRRAAVRHAAQPDPGQPARARRRTSAATSSATSATAARPPRRAPNGMVDRHGDARRLRLRRGERPAHAGRRRSRRRSRRSRPIPTSQIVVAAITGPTTPYAVRWKNPSTGRHAARGPRSRTRARRADTQLRRPRRSASTEFVQQFGANGLTLSICDEQLRAGADAHRRGDRPRARAAVHHRPRRRQGPGTARPSPTARSSTTPATAAA